MKWNLGKISFNNICELFDNNVYIINQIAYGLKFTG